MTRKEMTDAEFINDPFEWPRYPLLPMVSLNKERHPRYPFCAVMTNFKAPPYVVYHKPLGDFVTGLVSDQLEGVPFDSYDTVEALLKEWRID